MVPARVPKANNRPWTLIRSIFFFPGISSNRPENPVRKNKASMGTIFSKSQQRCE